MKCPSIICHVFHRYVSFILFGKQVGLRVVWSVRASSWRSCHNFPVTLLGVRSIHKTRRMFFRAIGLAACPHCSQLQVLLKYWVRQVLLLAYGIVKVDCVFCSIPHTLLMLYFVKAFRPTRANNLWRVCSVIFHIHRYMNKLRVHRHRIVYSIFCNAIWYNFWRDKEYKEHSQKCTRGNFTKLPAGLYIEYQTS